MPKIQLAGGLNEGDYNVTRLCRECSSLFISLSCMHNEKRRGGKIEVCSRNKGILLGEHELEIYFPCPLFFFAPLSEAHQGEISPSSPLVCWFGV